MKKYRVLVPEVWVQGYEIMAESPEQAIRKVMEEDDGEIIEDDFEFDTFLETDRASVVEI